MRVLFIILIWIPLIYTKLVLAYSIDTSRVKLTIEQANRLSELPLKCVSIEYPNKLGQVLSNSTDLMSPKQLHPAFYGCFDWHSSVHGHWMLVKLISTFPDLRSKNEIIRLLTKRLSSENIEGELDYFKRKSESSFERTYGWAWLLKLTEEIHAWKHPVAAELEQNLRPLTDYIVSKYIDFLPRLVYPIRVGEHSNTAFGLSFAWDYAIAFSNDTLKVMIEKRARDFYLEDSNCPLLWEPGGYDFLSPCLEEANLMRRILPEKEFNNWISDFLPELRKNSFVLQPGIVSDRTDGKLVHLDGLNFSRAWCLYGIAQGREGYQHLNKIAGNHIKYSLLNITDGAYEGEHWLASFAIYALSQLN